MIDGHVHGDGGVVSNLLIPLEFDDYRALAERLPRPRSHGADQGAALGRDERVDPRQAGRHKPC